MKIEDIIKEYREQHGLSQRQFAAQCGLSQTYIWYLETGKHPGTGKRVQPSLPALNKIARGMHVSLDELMSRCDNMLVAITDTDDDVNIFLDLFSQLSPAQRETVLSVMRSYLS